MLYGVAFIFIFTVGGLSGVLLSNASLDIAFHDIKKKVKYLKNNIFFYSKKYINYRDLYRNLNEIEFENLKKDYLKKFNNLSDKYIKIFFLGLLEGDGTITVDLMKSGNPRIRIIISLANKLENLEMLTLIKKKLKGRVIIERNNEYVTWIISDKKGVLNIFKIIEEYGLLTQRKYCQYIFAKNCLEENTLLTENEFKKLRDNKYNLNININIKKEIINTEYFKGWLSGFIEAEGNFFLLLSNTYDIQSSNFNIGQKNDYKILELIRDYFKSNTVISKDKKLYKGKLYYYRFHLFNKNSRKLLFNHLNNYPLLGEKRTLYLKWYYYFFKYKKID